MTLLSRKADYALLILSYLHARPVGGTARAIAEQFGLSRPFVANILKELCHKGFVLSHRGVKGGYALARPAASTSLAELLEQLEDGFRLTACSDGRHGHLTDDGCTLTAVCTVRGPMAEVHRRLIEVLRGVSLAEVFAPGGPAKPVGLASLPVLAAAAGGCCPSHHTAEPTPA